MCISNEKGHEIHFLFHCTKYDTMRNSFIRSIVTLFPDFEDNNNNEKLKSFQKPLNLYLQEICL